jgi:hypothetical protein
LAFAELCVLTRQLDLRINFEKLYGRVFKEFVDELVQVGRCSDRLLSSWLTALVLAYLSSAGLG